MSEHQPDQNPHPKQSETVFAGQIDAMERRAHKANVLYVGVRRAALSIGVAFALILPLALLPSPSDTADAPPVITTITQTLTESENDPDAQPDIIDTKVFVTVPINVDPAETGDMTIIGVPPMTRDWHRSEFGVGDELWALPGGEFKLLLTNLAGNCRDRTTSCAADFTLISNEFLGDSTSIPDAFTFGAQVDRNCDQPVLPGRCIGIDNSILASNPGVAHGPGCELRQTPLTPTAVCRFDHHDAAQGNDDICLWIRRSEQPEVASGANGRPHIALDIKWRTLPPGQAADTRCPDWNRDYRE